MSNFDDNRDWANSFSEFIEHATNEEIINFFKTSASNKTFG